MLKANKLDSVLNYLEGLLSIKSHDLLILWSWEIMWQTCSLFLDHHNSNDNQTWQGSLSSGAPTIESDDPLILWSCEIPWTVNWRHFIPTTTIPMTEKLRKGDELSWVAPAIRVQGTLITWSCQTTWQTKSIIPPVPRCLWPQNLTGWRTTMRISHSQSHIILQSHALLKSSDQINALHLHLNCIYSRQTWPGSNSWWEDSSN